MDMLLLREEREAAFSGYIYIYVASFCMLRTISLGGNVLDLSFDLLLLYSIVCINSQNTANVCYNYWSTSHVKKRERVNNK